MDRQVQHDVLIINCGSSSLKMAWLDAQSGLTHAKGIAERIGEPEARLQLERDGTIFGHPLTGADHATSLRELAKVCWPNGELPESIVAIGHRVVHGGEFFREPCWISDDVIQKIEQCAELAPLHNPAHLLGIRTAMELFRDRPHMAVFDTAFHQTLPEKAFHYAVPQEWYEQYRARKYGFHGTSHQFVSREAARLLQRPVDDCQLVTAHLGNGCSVCAVQNGRSVDTSMGLTPSEGLVMGTRSGDVDPNLAEFIAGKTSQSIHQVIEILNRKSGLLGLSGLSNDMRTLAVAADTGHPGATLAIDVFCFRLARQILAMCASLTRIDGLVFTGGIGENSALVRSQTLKALTLLHPEIDQLRNEQHGRNSEGRITSDGKGNLVGLVVPTNEEWMIGQFALKLCRSLEQ